MPKTSATWTQVSNDRHIARLNDRVIWVWRSAPGEWHYGTVTRYPASHFGSHYEAAKLAEWTANGARDFACTFGAPSKTLAKLDAELFAMVLNAESRPTRELSLGDYVTAWHFNPAARYDVLVSRSQVKAGSIVNAVKGVIAFCEAQPGAMADDELKRFESNYSRNMAESMAGYAENGGTPIRDGKAANDAKLADEAVSCGPVARAMIRDAVSEAESDSAFLQSVTIGGKRAGAWLAINGKPACEYFGHMAGMQTAKQANVTAICGYPDADQARAAAHKLQAIGVNATWHFGQCPTSAADVADRHVPNAAGTDFPALPIGNRENPSGAVVRELAWNLYATSEADFDTIARAMCKRLASLGYDVSI